MRTRTVASAELFTAVAAIITTPDLPALGPSARPNVKSLRELRGQLDSLFDKVSVPQSTQALIHAAALFWHDYLDEAHTIVQDAPSPEAAFIHGMMHRREPDYGNAKYWFNRVGAHVTFSRISMRVHEFLPPKQNSLASQLVRGGQWQPMTFIDACESVAKKPADDPNVALLQEVQKIEFDTLLEHLCTVPAGQK